MFNKLIHIKKHKESGEKQLENLTLQQLAKIMEISLPQHLNVLSPIRGVKAHIDNLNPGEVMLVTPYYPQDDQVISAIEKKAAFIIVQKKIASQYKNYDNIIPVEDVIAASAKFVSWVVSLFDAKRIAITGSIGKTTTTGLLNSILTQSMPTLTHDSMANSHGAVLRTVQRLKDEHKAYVQEVGGAFPGYVEASAIGLQPDILILTNINASHLDYYKTLEGILYDKMSLERYMTKRGVVFMDYDDPLLRSCQKQHRVISYGINSRDVDYYADNIQNHQDGVSFDYVTKEGERYHIHLNILGEHNVRNALAAIGVARFLGVPMDKIAQYIQNYKTEGIRQNLCTVGSYHLFIDCFNSSKESLLAATETLMKIPVENSGRHILFMGHIDRLGLDSKKIHSEIGNELAKMNVDLIVFYYGDAEYAYQSAISNGARNCLFIPDQDELIEWMRNNITRDDIALYKGGQLASRFPIAIDEVYGTEFQKYAQRTNQIHSTCGDFLIATVTGVLQVNRYTGNDLKVIIPDTFNGVPVKRISHDAFSKCRKLQEIVISDSVNRIGEGAFYICPKLVKVQLPKQLRYIARSAFNYCTSLKAVDLPPKTIHIECRAFYDCRSLERIYIPSSVGFIGDEAFGNCNKLLIECEAGSYAQSYAIKEKIPYQIVNAK